MSETPNYLCRCGDPSAPFGCPLHLSGWTPTPPPSAAARLRDHEILNDLVLLFESANGDPPLPVTLLADRTPERAAALSRVLDDLATARRELREAHEDLNTTSASLVKGTLLERGQWLRNRLAREMEADRFSAQAARHDLSVVKHQLDAEINRLGEAVRRRLIAEAERDTLQATLTAQAQEIEKLKQEADEDAASFQRQAQEIERLEAERGRESTYYSEALDLAAEQLRSLKPSDILARGPKIVAVLTNAAEHMRREAAALATLTRERAEARKWPAVRVWPDHGCWFLVDGRGDLWQLMPDSYDGTPLLVIIEKDWASKQAPPPGPKERG